LRIIRWFGPKMLDSSLPFISEQIEAQAVFVQISFCDEGGAEGDPLRRVDQAFKDGILHSLTAILTESRNPTQSATAGVVAGADVITHQDKHALPPEESRVSIEAATDESCQ
jgi:hypothetical protein